MKFGWLRCAAALNRNPRRDIIIYSLSMIDKSSIPSGPLAAQGRKRKRFMPGQLIVRVKQDAVRPGLRSAEVVMSARSAKMLPEGVRAADSPQKPDAKEIKLCSHATRFTRMRAPAAARSP
jgi:hypothetical protein